MNYNVKLDVFEGPLDLLLFFIKRDEVDIYDIPISSITLEYLEYLQMMQSMNLHLAGEFILMASMLMRIKAQMLLPHEGSYEEESIEDPRTELVQMLAEYQRYKEASEFFKGLESKQSRMFSVRISHENVTLDPDIFLSDVKLVDFGLIFKRLIDNLPKISYYEVETERVSISQQCLYLQSLFVKRKRIRFSEIARTLTNRIEIVVTFLAILELIRTGKIRVSQKTSLKDFWLTKIEDKSLNVVANA